MKKILFFIAIYAPFLLLSQENNCTKMRELALSHKNAGNLELALGEYISALNCDPGIGAEIAGEIKEVFDKINRQKTQVEQLYAKSKRLLAFFFYDNNINAAWALGKNGRYAVINRDGKTQGGGFIWENPQPFEHGRAIAQKGGEYYFISEKGQVLSNEGYDFVHPTTLGHYMGVQSLYKQTVDFVVDSVRGTKKERIRFLPKGFDVADENVFPFQMAKGKWGLMDTLGTIIIDEKEDLDTISKVYGGYASCRKANQWGYIGKNGQIPEWGEIIYDSVGVFEDSVAWRAKDGKFTLVILDQDGGKEYANNADNRLDLYEQYFSEHIYNQAWEIKKSTTYKKKSQLSKSQLGKTLSTEMPASITRKKGEIQHVTLYQFKDKFWVLDQKGDSVSGPYDDIIQISDTSYSKLEIFITQKRAQFGLLVFEVSSSRNDTSLTLIRELQPNFEDLGAFQFQQKSPNKAAYIRVKRNGKWGYVFWDDPNDVSPNTDLSIPLKYDLATNFFSSPDISATSEVARVYIEKFDLYFYINQEGKMIADIVRNKIW